jgi:glycosyltransferase involved in cell wall biosynthesis
MRIGIDFHHAEREGTGNCSYIRNLFEALLELEPASEYTLYVGNPRHPYYDRFRDRERVRLRPLWSRSVPGRLASLGILARGDKLDLLHVQYVAPPFFHGPLVVSVHDLAFLDRPECFSRPMRAYLKTLVPIGLRRAAEIMTLSEFSRKALALRFPECAAKVRVGPLAANPGLIGARARRRRDLHAIGVRGPFILCVGRLDARKNIPVLLRAFAMLRAGTGRGLQLVLAGPKDYWPAALDREWSESPFRRDILRTGLVSEGTLAGLYSAADVFAYPSLYEGFGLPVLEAMAAGCPVVASNATSLPEVVGRAGLLVPPEDPVRLASALRRVLTDKRLRADLVRKGRARAARFSWSETAKRTLAAYRSAAGRGG